MIVMTDSSGRRPKDSTKRVSAVVYGLLFGSALGLLVAVIWFPDAVALGLVIGAAVGVVAGAAFDAMYGPRRRR